MEVMDIVELTYQDSIRQECCIIIRKKAKATVKTKEAWCMYCSDSFYDTESLLLALPWD